MEQEQPQPLTTDALVELNTAIRDHYETFLRSRHARAHRTPYLRNCIVSNRWLYGNKVAWLALDIVEVERIPRYVPFERDISVIYPILKDGTISPNYRENNYENWTFYLQPLLQFLRNSNFEMFVEQREREAKARIQERTKAIHEELAMTVWHPDRVCKMLETSGFDMIDSC